MYLEVRFRDIDGLLSQLEGARASGEREKMLRVISVLGRLRDERATAGLIELLHTTTDLAVVRSVLIALSRIGDETSSLAVAALVTQPAPVGAWAARALSYLDPSKAAALLRDRAWSEPDARARRMMIRAYVRSEGSGGHAALANWRSRASSGERLIIIQTLVASTRPLRALRLTLGRFSRTEWQVVALTGLVIGALLIYRGQWWGVSLFVIVVYALFRAGSARLHR